MHEFTIQSNHQPVYQDAWNQFTRCIRFNLTINEINARKFQNQIRRSRSRRFSWKSETVIMKVTVLRCWILLVAELWCGWLIKWEESVPNINRHQHRCRRKKPWTIMNLDFETPWPSWLNLRPRFQNFEIQHPTSQVKGLR